MTTRVRHEWRAVAPSGRVVATFGDRALANAWRKTHPNHAVHLELAVHIEVCIPETWVNDPLTITG